ncbi:uncharacterized protein [Miscanthus floridulus]|uniref:uncharacterized protein n=1 Tax=Miscanthus floridulus TaxID=154761 RepID=UPI0034581D4B
MRVGSDRGKKATAQLLKQEYANLKNSREASSSHSGDGKRRGKASSEKKKKKVDPNACRCCWKMGHWAKECPNRKKEKKAEAHLAQADDDDEATPLMVMFCALHDVEANEKGEGMAVKGPSKALKAVHLNEPRAQLRSSIISIGQLDERGSEVLIKDGVLWIRDQEQHLLAKVKRSQNWLYLLDLKVEQLVCLAARHTEEPWLWHVQFSHLSFDALGRLEEIVRGLPHIEHVGELCDSCLARK